MIENLDKKHIDITIRDIVKYLYNKGYSARFIKNIIPRSHTWISKVISEFSTVKVDRKLPRKYDKHIKGRNHN